MSVAASVFPLTDPLVHRASVWEYLNAHIVVLNVITLAVVGVLMLAYIVQVNASTTKGYQIRELETRRAALSLQNQQLEVAAREAQSLENVARAVKMLGFVQAELPTFVVPGTPAVAMAE